MLLWRPAFRSDRRHVRIESAAPEVVAELHGSFDNSGSPAGSPGYRGTRQPDRLFQWGCRSHSPEDAPQVATEEEFLAVIWLGSANLRCWNITRPGTTPPRICAIRRSSGRVFHTMGMGLTGRICSTVAKLSSSRMTAISRASRGYAVNMAHARLLAADTVRASPKIYNHAVTHQFTLGQWVEVIVDAMGAPRSRLSAFRANSLSGAGAGDRPYGNAPPIVRHPRHPCGSRLYRYCCRQSKASRLPSLVSRELASPGMPEEFEEDIKAHYKTEERLAELDKAYRAQLAEVESMSLGPIDTPYAHPKKPNEKRDHREPMNAGWLRLFAVLSGVCAVAVSSASLLNAEAASAFLHWVEYPPPCRGLAVRSY